MILTVRELLSRRALDKKLNKLGKQERSDVADMARSNARLKEKLEMAEERMARAGADVQRNSQGTKR